MHDLNEIESGSAIKRSRVKTKVRPVPLDLTYLTGSGPKTEVVASPMTEGRESLSQGEASGRLTSYAYELESGGRGGVMWKTGMAYGFEFASIVLPHGYIFGSAYSRSSSDPVHEAGSLVFDVGYNDGNGVTQGSQGGLGSRTSVMISALLPGATGALEGRKIGDTANPTSRRQ